MRYLVFFPFFLILAGCVSNADRQKTLADIVTARTAFRDDVEGKACIDAFKAGMNDPNSFQMAGTFILDDRMTRMLSNGMIVFTVPVRGKNAMGGLVLKTRACDYQVIANKLTYVMFLEQ